MSGSITEELLLLLLLFFYLKLFHLLSHSHVFICTSKVRIHVYRNQAQGTASIWGEFTTNIEITCERHRNPSNTWSMMSLTLSCSQSSITLLSFLFSRSWKSERYASSFLSSFRFPTLMAVTCHFFSAAVSRTTCSVVRPGGKMWHPQSFMSSALLSNQWRSFRRHCSGIFRFFMIMCGEHLIFLVNV